MWRMARKLKNRCQTKPIAQNKLVKVVKEKKENKGILTRDKGGKDEIEGEMGDLKRERDLCLLLLLLLLFCY